jgi:hypothetical protein
MTMWYRVFGITESAPQPAALLAHLHRLGFTPRSHFRGDEQGWLGAELMLAEGATPLHLERYLSTEPDIRHELNTWAAMLETSDYSPNHVPLMHHMIRTKQVFTLRKPIDSPDEVLVENICVAVCRYLAECTQGVYQADDEGFFSPDGSLLLREY